MNVDYRYEDMTIVLVSKGLKKLGAIANIDRSSIQFSLHMNSADELSFSVYKTLDGNEEILWDDIYALRVIYCVELDMYFQIDVSETDSVNPCKTITGTALCESELSQIMLYNIEINTEIDIKREDYVITKFYNIDNPNGSLLNRILEKAPHYEIIHVDETLCDLQRQFSLDGTSIYDFFQGECAEQFNCLFKFTINEETQQREISVYDLNTICMNDDCSYREINGKRYRADSTMFKNDECPYCNSKHIKFYGEDTSVYIDVENLTNEIQFTTLTDQIKNAFKLVGGDDNMTAAIASQNPNGSDYLYYFSDETKRDMSEELNESLIEYDEDFNYYKDEYSMSLDDELVSRYNNIVNKYNLQYQTQYERELSELINPIVGYKQLISSMYNNIDLSLFLTSGLMPIAQEDIINAQTEKTNLEARYKFGKFNRCSLQKISSYTSIDTVENALKNYAKLYVKSGFVKVEVITDNWEYRGLMIDSDTNYYGVWQGHFKITNYPDSSDIAETFTMQITVDMDYEQYMLTTVKKDLMTTLKDETKYFDVVDYDITYSGNYSETFSYDVGDYCIYDFIYYKCIVAIEDGESWTPNHWSRIYEYDDETSYIVGDYCLLERNLWRCVKNTIGTFDKSAWTYGNISEKKLAMFTTSVLPLYCKNRLTSFRDATQGCMNILSTAGMSQVDSEHYEWTYYPYYVKLVAITNQLDLISSELNVIQGLTDNNGNTITKGITQILNDYIFEIQDKLNLKNYLIDRNVYYEFCSFRREDRYENGNYISVGLNNSQLFERANEFLDKANEEIVKAGTPQHQITSTIDNLFSLNEFKPFQKKCKLGNWIRVRVDSEVYRLRLITLGFNLSDFNTINVEFSDVTRINNVITDIQSIINQSKSMASSYSYIQNQANASSVATQTIETFRNDGLDFSQYNLKSSDREDTVIDKNGILLRSYNDITDSFENEQVRIVNNSIVFTDDNWVTVKAALGKSIYHYYGKDDVGIEDCNRQLQALREAGVESTDPRYIEIEQKIEELSEIKMRTNTGFGLNSDFVESGNIYGSSMIGGEIYSTNYDVGSENTPTGSYMNLNDGTFSFAGGNLIFDGAKLKFNGEISQTGGHITVFDASSSTSKLFNADISEHNVEIGGFSVEKDNMHYGTSAIHSNINGLYLGHNGIRNVKGNNYTCIEDGVLKTQNISDYDSEMLDKISKTDIVDNLTSSNTDKPLSAKQGKILNDSVSQRIYEEDIAPIYSTSSTYDVGDYCVYNHHFYICVTKISTPEQWNENKWQRTTVAAELMKGRI